MTKVRVSLNKRAVRDLLNSPEIVADLERRAARIAAAAGPGMASDAQPGKVRAHGRVWTDTPEAMLAEASDRALTAAIQAGR
ncbi:MAG TPA: hypothetical protein PLC03_15795 [Microthrixaceae bacterium]|nr:hypothetical protein [Microthrixaceae bacterium]